MKMIFVTAVQILLHSINANGVCQGQDELTSDKNS